MQNIPTIAERPAGRIPTTTVTNEHARAIAAMLPQMHVGQVVPEIASDRERWMVITNAGPDSEADFDNEQYWVVESSIDSTDSLTDEAATDRTHITTTADEPRRIVPATNRAEAYLDVEEGGITEYQSGTHALPKGTRVLVRVDVDGLGNPRYSFYHQPEYAVVPLSNASGGGKYIGNLYGGATNDASASGNLGVTDFGVLIDEDVLIFNGAEAGKSTHNLTVGDAQIPFPAVRRSRKSNDDPPKHVFLINGRQGAECATGA